MSLTAWIIQFALQSLFYKRILSWGGASYIKGWKSIFFLDTESSSWNEEQVKMMTLFLWIGFSILFVIGLIYPEYRFYKLKNSL